MSATVAVPWVEANQRYLSAATAAIRACLERCGAGPGALAAQRAADSPGQSPAALAREMPAPPAFERLRAIFRLSPFEGDLLLLCAAMELDAAIGPLCAAASDPQRPFPTFSLALAVLPGAHWSALSPGGPLRRWRLVEVGTGSALTLSPLRIDERVLHYLAGVQHLDERLAGLVEAVTTAGTLVASQKEVASQLQTAWSRAAERGERLPPVQLCGPDLAAKRAVAATACAGVGLGLLAAPADILPAAPHELEQLLRIWERDSALSVAALFLDCEELDPFDNARASGLSWLLERVSRPLIIANRDRRRTRGRTTVVFDVARPSREEQLELWQDALGPLAERLNGRVEELAAQFTLAPPAIASASLQVLGQAGEGNDGDVGRLLWDASRAQARPRLDDLSQRLEAVGRWEDLVLPEQQRLTLRQIAMHVRRRATVYERWGFAGLGARGLGISALFAGASGVGKTMAAEVLANELRLDLYRIDLSSVVSKYIGETEKNLRRVFDAAEDGGAILLFDEADALFGKRSEVKDSHDRFANIEVGYLLQRMEAYRGLAILTTNLKSALDPAFLRRLRFIVQFPFPDVPQRAEIWRRIFPPATPREGLDPDKLARLNVAGGNIRNIAMQAAFLAADAAEPVRMAHLLAAARTEYAKLEKTLTPAEIDGWA